jgi:putative colanic acid biosynthesis acetyltransferase WcaF
LRAYGAKIGHSVYIRRSIRIYFPWNLFVGDNCWLGEGVWFINHAPIKIGDDVCISQNAMICSSGHDYKNESLQYKHKAIIIHDGAWICISAIILGGSEIGSNSVVSAGETFSGELPDNSIYIKGENKLIENSK